MSDKVLLPNGKEFDFWERKITYKKELFVDCMNPNASDKNAGTKEKPFKSIQAAASRAVPGTHVWIGAGEYREWVRPCYGGDSPKNMVCYEAMENAKVVIKASELITEFEVSTDWRRMPHEIENNCNDKINIWKHKLEPNMFKGYNPFCAINILHDRLFIEYEKTDMTTYLNRRGMVFCDGEPLKQVALYNQLSQTEGSYWVEANGQTIHFRLKGDANPSGHRIEITCREQCFAPDKPFLSYIKVKGITCAHAATGAPVPQRGSISCYRGHHWIIENCTIDWSNCVGIDVGNECWHHEMIKNQLIGYSIVRGCNIYNAGVCGIAGLFSEHMLIEDNLIQGTGWQRMELSWEAGAIKLHNSVDGLFRRNIFKQTYAADHLWLDCGNENNRITQNLFLDGIEQREAIFIECTRDGVNLIDNNIFWNIEGRFDETKIPDEPGSKGWYKMVEHDVVNGYAIYGEGTDHLRIEGNLIGKCRSAGYFSKPVAFRTTPWLRGGTSRDAHIINNIFYECQEAAIKFPTEKNKAEGNLYVKETGGYLRVIHPEPEACLDLGAWREFYGFDKKGQEAWFDIEINTDTYELKMTENRQTPPGFEADIKKRGYVFNPEKVKAVPGGKLAANDFYNKSIMEAERVPGPFSNLVKNVIYKIDPRKTK